jgi:hypothetical protein
MITWSLNKRERSRGEGRAALRGLGNGFPMRSQRRSHSPTTFRKSDGVRGVRSPMSLEPGNRYRSSPAPLSHGEQVKLSSAVAKVVHLDSQPIQYS